MMDISRLLKQHWNLNVELVTRHRNGYCNVYRVTSREGEYALKKYGWATNLPLQTTLMLHLQDRGFLNVPFLIKDRENNPIVHQGNEAFVLTKWVRGHNADFCNVSTLRQLARLLAHFHNHSCNIDIDEKHIQHLQYGALEEGPSKLVDITIGQYDTRTMSKRLRQWANSYPCPALQRTLFFMNLARAQLPVEVYKNLLHQELADRCAVHRDFNTSNILQTSDGQLYLIDFDDCSLNIRVGDLAFFCHLHMGSKAQHLLDILRSYHKIRPLSTAEFMVLKSLLLIPGQVYWMLHLRGASNQKITPAWIKKTIEPWLSNHLLICISKFSLKDLA